MDAVPRLTLHRLIAQGRPPRRADRSAGGLLPTRAFRHCEPVTAAAAFGWYVFLPLAISLRWDGTDIAWRPDGGTWDRLGAAQAPGFAAVFDAVAPAGLTGFSPPLIGALPEPGLVQIWTGLAARTAPGWSLLVRPCANLPGPGGYELFEGIIETDRWFGPLITNLRLTRTGSDVVLRDDMPFVQIQAIPRSALDETGQNDTFVSETLSPADWADFAAVVARPQDAPGAYAIQARKRKD